METALLTRQTEQKEWFASWFDSEHYHKLYAQRDRAEAARFIDALARRLRPAAGADALDLGCGTGRHATRLASHDLNVTGLDLSKASIRIAKPFEHERLRFACHDMRRAFGEGVFDYVFNLFTSFGYFEEPSEHLTVIRNIATSLKMGGRLIIDYLNVRCAVERETAAETVERNGTRFHISRWNDATHFYKRIIVDDDRLPAPREHVERVAKFTAHDFALMLSLYGMGIEERYGDYRLSSFDEASSPRLILVARKQR
jgi:SAM-dependent methyltransferase